MIVCSCNRLTDRDVLEACANGTIQRAPQIYAALDCKPKCGRCMITLDALLQEHRGQSCACRPGDCPCANAFAETAAA